MCGNVVRTRLGLAVAAALLVAGCGGGTTKTAGAASAVASSSTAASSSRAPATGAALADTPFCQQLRTSFAG